jgi:hypothetical protein
MTILTNQSTKQILNRITKKQMHEPRNQLMNQEIILLSDKSTNQEYSRQTKKGMQMNHEL